MGFLKEDDIEQALLEQFGEIGYETAPGAEISSGGARPERRSYGEVVLRERLRSALVKINAQVPAGAVEEALRRVERPEVPGLVESNRRFHRLLVEGVEVEIQRPARAGGGVSYETVARPRERLYYLPAFKTFSHSEGVWKVTSSPEAS